MAVVAGMLLLVPESRGSQSERGNDVASAGASIAALSARPATAAAGRDAESAFSTATRWAAFSAAGFLGLGLIASLSLGPSRRQPADPEGEAAGSQRSRGGEPAAGE